MEDFSSPQRRKNSHDPQLKNKLIQLQDAAHIQRKNTAMGVLQSSPGRSVEDHRKQVLFSASQLMEHFEIAAPTKPDRISGFAQKVEEQKI